MLIVSDNRKASRVSPPSTSPLHSNAAAIGVAIFLTGIFVITVSHWMWRRLWFDELFTYYIAQEPSLPRLFEAIVRTDLNPPLVYLLVRLFQSFFGPSEFVTRLPATIAFYLGSMGAFWFLKRRVGPWWSAVGILIFWMSEYVRYAAHARPYGLLIGFFAVMLLSYDAARLPDRSRWAVPILAAGTIGMMLSHVFAPLSIFPFCVAEAIRGLRRRMDWPVWSALVLPVSLSVLYVAETRYFRTMYFPEAFQASGWQMIMFFERIGFWYVLWLVPAMILAFVAAPYSKGRPRKLPGGWAAIAWSLALMLPPIVINLAMMPSKGAFWERYCITTALGYCMLVAVGLAWITGFRFSSAVMAIFVLSFGIFFNTYETDSQVPIPSSLKAIPADLPIVAGSGLTFLEMDHYDTEFRSRLYYLVDREAAIQYAHATIFENFPVLVEYFPIRSHVSRYSEFLAAHEHFLVLTRADFQEAWVLKKLCVDGAEIQLIRTLPGPSRKYQLYDVQR